MDSSLLRYCQDIYQKLKCTSSIMARKWRRGETIGKELLKYCTLMEKPLPSSIMNQSCFWQKELHLSLSKSKLNFKFLGSMLFWRKMRSLRPEKKRKRRHLTISNQQLLCLWKIPSSIELLITERGLMKKSVSSNITMQSPEKKSST